MQGRSVGGSSSKQQQHVRGGWYTWLLRVCAPSRPPVVSREVQGTALDLI